MTINDRLSSLRDLVQFDISERGLARDPECNLVNAFPGDFAAACRSIAEHPSPKVAFVTGFWIPEASCGETDGPLGAVFLANAFHSLGIPTQILTDGFSIQAIEVGLDESGTRDVIAVSTDLRESVTHLIAIERVGPAADGRCYTMRGRDITEFMDSFHRLFEAPLRPITFGIGDGGNEIGMGKIPVETIERNIPNGRMIACRTATDFLIVAGISNWGAYALAAGVALVRGQQLDARFFESERELRILKAMVERGPLVDGKTGERAATVDGVSFEEYVATLSEVSKIARPKL